MYTYLIAEILAAIASFIAFLFLIRFFLRREGVKTALQEKGFIVPAFLLIVFLIIAFFANKTYPPDFERVNDISASTAVPASSQKPDADNIVRISLEAQEVIAETAPGIYFNYWTYNKQVPGPFLRVREGDVIELTLSNHPSSLHPHNIDLHAVTGPGGGKVRMSIMRRSPRPRTYDSEFLVSGFRHNRAAAFRV